MAKKTLKIHSENILPIIKKWLYSEKDIFLRELVSNAVDAISKLKLLQTNKKAKQDTQNFRIDITLDKDAKTLAISDNGIGMSQDEVENYIAQIAFSGAEEFLKKYKSDNEKDHIIGHFGLGFYSAYMVAKKVEIQTLTFQKDEKAVFWSCDGSSKYEIAPSDKRSTRGTDVILHLESDEYLDEAKIRSILTRFCPFLPYPIYLNNEHINNNDPLYLKSPSECTDKEYLDFYQKLYPFEKDPIFWIHLNVDYPFRLKGILYFPKFDKNFDVNKSQMKLFCNRVFVSDHCKDLLPEYLTVLRGAIDSSDLPLNVSRSYLQVDQTVKKLGDHISKKVSDRLATIYRTDKEKFINSFKDIEMILKLGALQDEKFYDRIKSLLIFENTNQEWTTIEEYLDRNKEKIDKKVFYVQDDKMQAHFLDLYKEKGIEILHLNSYIDTPLMSLIERKASIKFQRIDGGVDETILDSSKEKSLLDSDGKSEAANIAEFIRSHLSKEIEVEAKSLASETLPGFILIKEEERRFRDYMQLTQNELLTQKLPQTFVVNTNNKMILHAKKLSSKNPKLAKEIVLHLFDLAKLAQKELPAEEISSFISRSNQLLESLVEEQFLQVINSQ